MLVRRFTSPALVLLLVAAVAVAPAGASAGPAATASKKGKAAKKCPKGKKLATVTKNGHKVKKCVPKGKKPGPTPPCRAATASCALPPLFDPPGKKLEGDEANSYVLKYLHNSTFTDCVAGWPSCGGFENRYSHATDGTFHKCILRPSSGSDILVTDEYAVEGSVVEPDGTWTFREVVYDHGYYPHYEWRVRANGAVEGAYQFQSEPVEHIGPLQYVGGVAKDCSY
jgi:hypothetical protein